MVAVTSCKKKQDEKQLQYYATPNPYEIIAVTEPSQDNEVRNVIIMIGDGMAWSRSAAPGW